MMIFRFFVNSSFTFLVGRFYIITFPWFFLDARAPDRQVGEYFVGEAKRRLTSNRWAQILNSNCYCIVAFFFCSHFYDQSVPFFVRLNSTVANMHRIPLRCGSVLYFFWIYHFLCMSHLCSILVHTVWYSL